MPMVMYSFFEEYDFSGKTIIPFNVHNRSRFSGTISTIQELEPNASVVTDGFTVSERSEADTALRKFSENFSTHLFTVLTKYAIVISQVEQKA